MRQAIQSGRFGEPLEVIAVFGQHFPFYRPGLPPDVLCEPRHGRRRNPGCSDAHHQRRRVARGTRRFAGGRCGPPGACRRGGRGYRAHAGTAREDYGQLQPQPASGPERRLPSRSSASKGTVRFEVHTSRWRWTTEAGAPWHDEPSEALERDTIFTLQANAFLDAVEGLRLPLCTLAEAEQTLRVNLATMSSAENRNWESIGSTPS